MTATGKGTEASFKGLGQLETGWKVDPGGHRSGEGAGGRGKQLADREGPRRKEKGQGWAE